MIRRPVNLLVLLAGFAIALSGSAYAETLCTYVTTNSEYPIPMAERESLRQTQQRLLLEHTATGDQLAAAGKDADAAVEYSRVFERFRDRGVHFGYQRCLSSDSYQRVADKLRTVATRVSRKQMSQGNYIAERGSNNGPAALNLLLMSNQYDAFITHALEYAAAELPESDVDVAALSQQRLYDLEQTRNARNDFGSSELDNDLTPLLNEELAAFDKLANFDEKLRAHLAPLYPRITDRWLNTEAENYAGIKRTDNILGKSIMPGPEAMALNRATEALKSGIRRLYEHPEEVARLRKRANVRGDALMKREQYRAAEIYFSIARNDKMHARVGELADSQEKEFAEQQTVTLQSTLKKMQKTDEEKAAFEDDTDAMAKEFGFDLEE